MVVRFEGDGWPPDLERDAEDDLRAGLRVRGIQLCSADQAQQSTAVATIVLHWNPLDSPLVNVEVQDALTNKRVLRDIALDPIAADARALALAQAADELLRASWVELKLHDAPAPSKPPPAVVQQAVELPEPSVPAPSSKLLGARFAVDIYDGGSLRLFGADAYVAFWLADRLGLGVTLGVRSAGRVDAAHGTLDASALTVSANAMLPLLPRQSRFNLLVDPGIFLGELALTGRADSRDVRSQSRIALVASARIELCGVLRLSDALQIELSVGPALSLRAATAVDSGNDIVSTRGLSWHGTVGLGGLL